MLEKLRYSEIREKLEELNGLIDKKYEGYSEGLSKPEITERIVSLVKEIPADYLFKRNSPVFPPAMKALLCEDKETMRAIITHDGVTSKHLLQRFPITKNSENPTYIRYINAVTDNELMEAALTKLSEAEREENIAIIRKAISLSGKTVDDTTPVLKEVLGMQIQPPSVRFNVNKNQQRWIQ